MMECGSTTFPTCASRANFIVRVCLFTSRMVGSATPLAACSPTGLSRSRKTKSTNGATTNSPHGDLRLMVLYHFVLLKANCTVNSSFQIVIYCYKRVSSSRPNSNFLCFPAIPRAHACITPSSMFGMSRWYMHGVSISNLVCLLERRNMVLLNLSSSMPASTVFNWLAYHLSRGTRHPTNMQCSVVTNDFPREQL